MSEQVTNSQDKTAEITTGLEKYFGGGEPDTRQRGPDGKFVPTKVSEDGSGGGGEEQETVQEEAQEAEATEQEQTQQQPEEVEVEIDGEKYVVPKKISDRFIHHADYTRKTQDIAEMRRALSAEREATMLEKAFSNSVTEENNQLALINVQLAQFQRVDWSQMETEQLLRTRAQFDQLKDAKSQIEAQVKAKRGDFDEKIKNVTQEALSAGLKYIQQHIKGYDEGLQKQLHEYGRSEGYTQEELSRIIDPRIVVTLWKASQWDALKASSPGVTKRAASAAPVVRPGASQKQPSQAQRLNQGFKAAKTPQEKKAAAEEYFAARLGGGR